MARKIAPVWRLTSMSARTFWQYRGTLTGITVVYGVLDLFLAKGLGRSNDIAANNSNAAQFVNVISSVNTNSSTSSGSLQFFFGIFASLAVIWTLRQTLSGKKVGVRDAYYRGMYPLIPFIILLLIAGLQLLPAAGGSALYAVIVGNGIAAHLIEKIVWSAVFAASIFLSLYLLSSTVFALYIVTLPEMTPLKALRSARELVRKRRLLVMRKIIALPIILTVVAAIIIVPVIFISAGLAQWIFFLLTIGALTATHIYMYSLYRELLA